jgi:chemotaxis protein MotB
LKPGEEDTKAHELVIIKRRSGGEEGGHHGGVWKIAYADFMTAMMAFFLVMWLINSTDQKVLTQVANYFNPMRLTDSTPHSKGVNSIESGEQGKQGKQSSIGDPKEKANAKEKASPKEKAPDSHAEKSPAAKAEVKEQPSAEAKARFSEQSLFSDPYGVLARIAAEADADAPQALTKEAGKGTDVYRDPFDPTAKPVVPDNRGNAPKKAAADAKKTDTATAGGEAKIPQDTDSNPGVAVGPDAKQPAPAAGGKAKTQQENATLPNEAATAVDPATEQAGQELAKAAKLAAEQKALQDEAAKIAQDLKRLTAQLPGTIPTIDVKTTDDGVLISLTDDYDFGMFAVASAEPRPAMVVVMEKVAKILQRFPEPLIVRGHTDGRPYRSGTYDNWRLSTARAHMAYYMLVRGGVDDKRFERVEGYADRSLRIANDPEAAQNRRIEILLRRPKQ